MPLMKTVLGIAGNAMAQENQKRFRRLTPALP
jgi:hypothetical protein